MTTIQSSVTTSFVTDFAVNMSVLKVTP